MTSDRATDPRPLVEYKQYQRTAIAEMADWFPGFDMTDVSVSVADQEAGSPKPGDKIARNPANHADRWLVAADYFADNFEALAVEPPPVAREPWGWVNRERWEAYCLSSRGVDALLVTVQPMRPDDVPLFGRSPSAAAEGVTGAEPDNGCSMAGRVDREHGVDGHCAVRNEPCPPACLLKAMRSYQSELNTQEMVKCDCGFGPYPHYIEKRAAAAEQPRTVEREPYAWVMESRSNASAPWAFQRMGFVKQYIHNPELQRNVPLYRVAAPEGPPVELTDELTNYEASEEANQEVGSPVASEEACETDGVASVPADESWPVTIELEHRPDSGPLALPHWLDEDAAPVAEPRCGYRYPNHGIDRRCELPSGHEGDHILTGSAGPFRRQNKAVAEPRTPSERETLEHVRNLIQDAFDDGHEASWADDAAAAVLAAFRTAPQPAPTRDMVEALHAKITDEVEAAIDEYMDDQYAGTGLPSENAAGRILNLLYGESAQNDTSPSSES